MISMEVSSDVLKGLGEKLNKLYRRVNNPRPLVNDIANYMIRVTQNRIVSTKRAPDGTKWAPNSELTQYLKGRNSPLYASGSLASSITVIWQSAHGIKIGSRLPYAGYMQNGVRKVKGRYRSNRSSPQIPARPFLGFSEANKKKIAQMMNAYILKGQDVIPEDME